MDAFLARLPLFKGVSPQTLDELSRRFILRRHKRKEVVFEEGDPPRAVFLLKSGLVKAVKYSPKVEPFTMDVIVPGRMFGMLAILDKKPYPVSAVCIHDSEVYHIPADVFEELLGRHPEFSREVFKCVGSHLRHSQVMRSLVKEPAEKRLAHILCLLGDMLGKELRVSREDIAEMAGCTPETAIRVLVDFRKKKLIASGWKRITLVDPAALKAFAG
jgi:CRP-like cAMP-binding protein